MKRHLNYLKYVVRHKWFVMVECFRLGIPFLGLVHDISKFSPMEWISYAHTFYKPNGEKQYVESVEFAHSWMLHQHRNKHHWQYWLHLTISSHNCGIPLPESDYMVWDRGEVQRVVKRNSGPSEWLELQPSFPGDFLTPKPMPDKYRREMLADWRGAGRALGKPDTKAWYLANKDKMMLHPETRAWIESALDVA